MQLSLWIQFSTENRSFELWKGDLQNIKNSTLLLTGQIRPIKLINHNPLLDWAWPSLASPCIFIFHHDEIQRCLSMFATMLLCILIIILSRAGPGKKTLLSNQFRNRKRFKNLLKTDEKPEKDLEKSISDNLVGHPLCL